MKELTTRRIDPVVWVVFCLSLSLYAVGTFFPHLRVWGVSLWAHFSPYITLIAIFVTGLAGFLISRNLAGAVEEASSSGAGKSYTYFGILVTLLLMASFYLFRNQIHFLGDGYALLANLAADNPIIKGRNYGETLSHQLVYLLIGGENIQSALLSFQIVSWLGGLSFVLATILFARPLFGRTVDRILFAMGMLGGGYMLLFFGYAEHYSLFVPSVAWFAYTGLLIAKGKMRRWYILAPLATAIFMHIFGLFLLPAAVYLLVADTKISAAWMKLKRSAKLGLIVVAVVLMAVVLYRMYADIYFFRFALVPLIEDNFTLDGYTVFSPAHLLDICNLIVLLFPGIIVAAVMLLFLPVRSIFRARDGLFLLLLLLSCFAAVSLFDPKLGMPRDWDLFSFFGLPLVLSGYYVLITAKERVKMRSTALVLSVMIGFFALAPRVAGQTVPDIGMAHIIDYARLDMKKSLFLFQHIGEYYMKRGEFRNSPLVDFNWERHYPEWRFTNAGLEHRRKREYKEAVGLFERAIDHNPMFQPAYANLGSAYLELGQADSALKYLKIANGLRPYHPGTLRDLGYAYLRLGRKPEAEECWKRALTIDPSVVSIRLNLLDLYASLGENEKYVEYLMQTAEREDAPASVYRRLGDYYVSQQSYDKAAAEYRRSVERGLPKQELDEIYRQFPMLPPIE